MTQRDFQGEIGSCHVHLFPPGEFAEHYIRHASPDLADYLIGNAQYLFAILTNDKACNANGAADDEDDVAQSSGTAVAQAV